MKRSWPAHVTGILVLVTLVATFVNQLIVDGTAAAFILVLTVTLGVGWLLAARLPHNALGWLLMAVPALFATWLPADLLGAAMRDTAPEVTQWLYWYGLDRKDAWAWLPGIGLLFTQIPLRFPDGRLPSRGWRWFSWFTIGAIVAGSAVLSTLSAEVAPGIPNPVHLPGVGEQAWLVLLVFGGLLLPSFVGSIASLFVRYRRAGILQRAQLRWVLWAAALVAAALMASWMLPAEFDAVKEAVKISYALIPIAILFAVLRYRLYEINAIISRTASYALVTLVVIGTYLLVVTSVHWLLPDLSAIGVALATLAAAALFLPALRWVQRWVDRRFDRERYDAEKVVDAFGQRLRTGADPHATPDDLIAAVGQTLQPSSVGLWTPRRAR